MQNQYELLLLLDPDLPQQRQDEIVKRSRELIERGGGAWVRQDVWGRRRLAYPIAKKTDGVYQLLEFDATPETLDELSRILKITDGVLRHLPVHRVQSSHGPGRPTDEPVHEPEYAAANASSQEEE